MRDLFPHCIRAIVQREDTPEAAVSVFRGVWRSSALAPVHRPDSAGLVWMLSGHEIAAMTRPTRQSSGHSQAAR